MSLSGHPLLVFNSLVLFRAIVSVVYNIFFIKFIFNYFFCFFPVTNSNILRLIGGKD